MQCTFAVKEVNNYFNRNNTIIRAVVLDARKAFNRIEYVKLFQLMIDRKLCPIVLRCILIMYMNQMLCVKWDHNKTPLFKTTNGVKQGGVLSPILFTVYIH